MSSSPSRPGILFGAYGTLLTERGLQLGIPDLGNAIQILKGAPYDEETFSAASAYLSAGATHATTNTFSLRDLIHEGEKKLARDAAWAHYQLVLKAIDQSRRQTDILFSVGPYGDCYKPEEAPKTPQEARDFHRENIALLEGARQITTVLFETFTTAREALGAAWASEKQGRSAIISFVVDHQGKLFDGMELDEAIRYVDGNSERKHSYGLNCSPIVGIEEALRKSDSVAHRINTIYPNRSNHDPRGLDGNVKQGNGVSHGTDSETRARELVEILRRHPQIKIVGHCCGSDGRCVSALSKAVAQEYNEIR